MSRVGRWVSLVGVGCGCNQNTPFTASACACVNVCVGDGEKATTLVLVGHTLGRYGIGCRRCVTRRGCRRARNSDPPQPKNPCPLACSPVSANGFGIGYIIKDQGIQFCVCSKHRQTVRWVGASSTCVRACGRAYALTHTHV